MQTTVLPGRDPDRDVRVGSNRKHGLLEVRLPTVDAVDVDRRSCEGAYVELVCSALIHRHGAVPLEDAGTRVEVTPACELLGRRWSHAFPELVRNGDDRESVCISACTALRAAPP